MSETAESVAHEARADIIAKLTGLFSDPEVRVYAVIDGSIIPYLLRKLPGAGIAHRSLYHETAEPALRAGGPWLVDLYYHPLTDDDLYEPSDVPNTIRMKAEVTKRLVDPVRQFAELMKIAEDSRGAVFWVGDADMTEEILYRHLRGLNRISVPTEPGSLSKMETVTFRHADANVMAQVIPALEGPQLARFFGPAHAVISTPYAEWYSADWSSTTCFCASRPANLPPAPNGMLTWDAAAMARISERRQAKFRREIADYLRTVAPQHPNVMDAEALEFLVERAMREALSFGVSSVAAHCRWTYLFLVTNGALARNDAVREFMTTDASLSPDARVALLMKHARSRLQPSAKIGGQ